MSYSTKANQIRRELGNFTKDSVVLNEVERLSEYNKSKFDSARLMPWISFLMIEWLYQIDESHNAKVATMRDSYRILNSIYKLQNDALRFDDNQNLQLALRRLMIGQLWCQQHSKFHIFTLIRYYYLYTDPKFAEYFHKVFLENTSVSITRFMTFSLWFIVNTEVQKGQVKYEQVITNFYPTYTIEELKIMLALVSAGPSQIKELMMSKHEINIGHEQYYRDTLLLKSPLLRFENAIVGLHHSLVSKGLASKVTDLLKNNDIDRYKRNFSKLFETYIGTILIESGISFQDERSIIKTFSAAGVESKVIDYLVCEDNSNVFIDAKAIEPPTKVLVTDDAKIIRQRLKSSFLKGVEQAIECCSTLVSIKSKLASYESRYALIVTNEDFYISTGVRFSNMVDNSFFNELRTKYGDMIPGENVFFSTVEDFESIATLCRENSTKLSAFLDYAKKEDSKPETSKFLIRQHIEDYLKSINCDSSASVGSDALDETKRKLFEDLGNTVTDSKRYWQTVGESGIPEFIVLCQKLKNNG